VNTQARREGHLSTMWDRFPAVADRVGQVYGLRVPRHLAVFCALWASLDAAEREGLDYLEVSPLGLTRYFGDDGLRLAGRDGLDERLDGRFRRDPAEFVPVLMGGSDGEHFGLWYDDPAELPSFVAYNYARDSAETWTDRSPTIMAELRRRIRRIHSDYGDDGDEAQLLQPLASALDWFTAAEREALAADGPPRWAASPRVPGWISISPVLPPDSGDPRMTQSRARLSDFRSGAPDATGWIAQAEQELTAGRPALALTVGSELHWLDADQYRHHSRDLLVGAYRALGRDALAEIVEVHTDHRDLRNVDILVARA
jgi:hypothetical protein